jgi:hypothetical protein
MKVFLFALLLALSFGSYSDDHFNKNIYSLLKESNKELIKNNVVIESRGVFVKFYIHGVISLTGRANYLTQDGEIITMTVPSDEWKTVSSNLYKAVKIKYSTSDYNVNYDLTTEFVGLL